MRASGILLTLAGLPALLLAGLAHADERAARVFDRGSPAVYSIIANGSGGMTMLGSGVVVGDERIATNYHVIKNAQSIRVKHGIDEAMATVESYDPKHDLALLAAPGVHVQAASIASTAEIAIGQTVYAIGSPRGLDLSLSEGLVSSLRATDDGNVIQTTAAISPGSSGGGLFDVHGRLLGFTTAQVVDGQNLNFAVPVEWLRYIGVQPEVSAVSEDESEGSPAADYTPHDPAPESAAVNTALVAQQASVKAAEKQDEGKIPTLVIMSIVILLILLGAKPAVSMLADWLASDATPAPVHAGPDRVAPFRAQAREELATGKHDADAWLRAIEDSQGNDIRAKAAYIELRAQDLYRREMNRRWELARNVSASPAPAGDQRQPPER